jgi:hypothetical protein
MKDYGEHVENLGLAWLPGSAYHRHGGGATSLRRRSCGSHASLAAAPQLWRGNPAPKLRQEITLACAVAAAALW